jgi:eukaryotic-like serine/threonine-protein kinase
MPLQRDEKPKPAGPLGEDTTVVRPLQTSLASGRAHPVEPESEAGQRAACELEDTTLTEGPPKQQPAAAARRPELRTFAAGQLVARRYRIVRFIARGAMGQVYEAEDLELRERVALKTLPPEMLAVPEALERLRREVHLARRVTHPNACRLFHLERHEAPGQAPILFLTMELLDGETLSAHLRRGGRLEPDQALPLVRQMAEALQAMHDAGVVHCDFKSGNVMLVPSAAGLRAAITDFGLASGDPAQTRNEAEDTDTLFGTPAYMAPEQVVGKPATPASDLYALGVVMYEMLTGQRPYTGSSMMSVALKRLEQAPSSPQTHVPGLDPRWEAAILRCLEREPEKRFAHTSELLRALAAPEAPPAREPPQARRGGKRAALVLAGLVGLGAAAHLGGWLPLTRIDAPSWELAARRSVAVLGFENLSRRPETAWLADALTELIGTELAAGEHLRLLAPESVARVRLELGISELQRLPATAIEPLRTNLGTQLVILGSYLALGEAGGGKLRLDVLVQETSGGQVAARMTETGTEAELLELVERMGARLRKSFGVSGLSVTERSSLAAARPRSAEAARLYSAGLARLRLSEALEARGLLEQAVLADPLFPMGHLALAAAWSALGHDREAKAEARRAFELSGSLSREEQLTIEGRFREAMREWDRAVTLCQALWSFFPDNLEHGLRLAEVQSAAGRGQDALRTVEELRALPPPSRDDPRIDLAAAAAAMSLSDFRGQLEAAGRAAAGAEKRGARLLLAQARLSEWWAHRTLGEMDRAVAAAAEAKRIYAESGYRGGIARALNAEATVALDLGRLDTAYAAEMQALGVFREIGDERRISWSLNNLARILRQRGQLDEARKRYEDSVEICRRLDDKSGLARALANTGRVLLEQGGLQRARAMFVESLEIREAIGEARGIAGARVDLGLAAWRQGSLAEAAASLETAAEQFLKVGDKQSASYGLAFLGEILAAQGDLPGARMRHEKALELRREVQANRLIAASRLALAALDLEEGQPASAEAGLRGLLADAPGLLAQMDQALAHALLARALAAQGQRPAALEAAEQAHALAAGSEYLAERLEVEIAAVLVQATGAPETLGAGRARIEAASAQAAAAGLGGVELAAWLARCQLEARGQGAEAAACFAALGQEAAARGFGLIAGKARAGR